MQRKEFLKKSLAGSVLAHLLETSINQHPSDNKHPLLLSDLEPNKVDGNIMVDRAADGSVLNIGELVYENGIGTSVPANITYPVPDEYERLNAWAGIDLASTGGQARLKVLVDDKTAFDSGKLQFDPYSRRPGVNAGRAIKVSVPVDSGSTVTLVAEGAGEGLLANWGNLRLLPAEWPEYRPREMATVGAATPPMGWNSWNAFGREIKEEIIHDIADTLVEKGFRKAGYNYLNLDDGWQADNYRDSEGYPIYDKRKFPDGMKKFGDYIHSKDLKFGIYSRPDWVGGSDKMDGLWTGGNEHKHSETFAEWGVDYLKWGLCRTPQFRNFYHNL